MKNIILKFYDDIEAVYTDLRRYLGQKALLSLHKVERAGWHLSAVGFRRFIDFNDWIIQAVWDKEHHKYHH